MQQFPVNNFKFKFKLRHVMYNHLCMCCSGSIEKSHGIKKVTESGSAVQSVSQFSRGRVDALEGDPRQIIQILDPVAAPHLTPALLLKGKLITVHCTQPGQFMSAASSILIISKPPRQRQAAGRGRGGGSATGQMCKEVQVRSR